MSNKFPVFSIVEPQHFNGDYGFESQTDYFQISKEAKKHKKPISKDDFSKKIKKQSHRKKWWRNALFFFNWNKKAQLNPNDGDLNSGMFHRRRRAVFGGSIYGPMYITESRTGSSSPRRKTRRHSSGRLAGSLTTSMKGDFEISYTNLKEFNMDRQHRISRTSAAPIYLVT